MSVNLHFLNMVLWYLLCFEVENYSRQGVVFAYMGGGVENQQALALGVVELHVGKLHVYGIYGDEFGNKSCSIGFVNVPILSTHRISSAQS